MEKHKEIVLELSNQELVLLQLLIFYFCSKNGVELTNVEGSGIEIKPTYEFIKEQLERIDQSTVRLKLPKEFLRLLENIFGAVLEDMVLSCSDLEVIDDLECLQNIGLVNGQLVTEFFICPDSKGDSERYLSIDLGIKNPVTVVDSKTGRCLIFGRDYMSRSHYFDKKIQELKNQYIGHGLENFETNKMKNLVSKKENTLTDILHKITRYLTDYCKEKNITQVVVGDIKERPGSMFPYNRFFRQLKKKLKAVGIKTVKQSEYFTSQCPPDSPEVSKEYAEKQKRETRGLFKDGKSEYNADGLGAFNILRSYLNNIGKQLEIPLKGIISPTVVTVSD